MLSKKIKLGSRNQRLESEGDDLNHNGLLAILSQRPPWIVRNGMVALFFLVSFIIYLSILVKYEEPLLYNIEAKPRFYTNSFHLIVSVQESEINNFIIGRSGGVRLAYRQSSPITLQGVIFDTIKVEQVNNLFLIKLKLSGKSEGVDYSYINNLDYISGSVVLRSTPTSLFAKIFKPWLKYF